MEIIPPKIRIKVEYAFQLDGEKITINITQNYRNSQIFILCWHFAEIFTELISYFHSLQQIDIYIMLLMLEEHMWQETNGKIIYN